MLYKNKYGLNKIERKMDAKYRVYLPILIHKYCKNFKIGEWGVGN
jgi:hypothetical protein